MEYVYSQTVKSYTFDDLLSKICVNNPSCRKCILYDPNVPDTYTSACLKRLYDLHIVSENEVMGHLCSRGGVVITKESDILSVIYEKEAAK